jgi:hypothetical protein
MSIFTALDICLEEGHVYPTNPRAQAAFGGLGACARCGRAMPSDRRERDLERERDWTLQAAKYAPYVSDPEPLAESFSRFRESRTGTGPWLQVSERDWIVEALEEVADLSAYICAQIAELEEQDRDDEDAGKLLMLLQIAHSSAASAYAALIQYRPADS